VTLKFDLWPWNANRVLGVVKVHVHAKYVSSSWVQRFMGYRANKLFALSRNGEISDHPVVWPWRVIYDLENQQGSCSYQDTCSCKISWSYAQRFVNYREKNLRRKRIRSVATERTVEIAPFMKTVVFLQLETSIAYMQRLSFSYFLSAWLSACFSCWRVFFLYAYLRIDRDNNIELKTRYYSFH